MDKTFLFLGGAGLIGGEVVSHYALQGATIVVADILQRSHAHLNQYNSVRYEQADIFEPGALADLIFQVKPDYIVNTVNVATIFSSRPHGGYGKLVKFYLALYRVLSETKRPVRYLQVGTTGSGGLGFNIPFTHGAALEELPIINKAAFAGISSSMLMLLSRSFGERQVVISELKPGLAVFRGEIHTREWAGTPFVTIDGGESGHYTYNELALLTEYMGFTTANRIALKVASIIDGKQPKRRGNAYDLTGALNATVISTDRVDIRHKRKLLSQMRKLDEAGALLATGNLGPPSTTRDILLGYVLTKPELEKRLLGVKSTDFLKTLRKDPRVDATFGYVTSMHPRLGRYLSKELNRDQLILLRTILKSEDRESWQVAKRFIENRHVTSVAEISE